MYILRLPQENSVLYFVSHMGFGMANMTNDIKFAYQFETENNANDANGMLVHDFEILEV